MTAQKLKYKLCDVKLELNDTQSQFCNNTCVLGDDPYFDDNNFEYCDNFCRTTDDDTMTDKQWEYCQEHDIEVDEYLESPPASPPRIGCKNRCQSWL